MLEASNLTDNTFLRQYEVKIGLSLNNLIDLYLSDNEVMMNQKEMLKLGNTTRRMNVCQINVSKPPHHALGRAAVTHFGAGGAAFCSIEWAEGGRKLGRRKVRAEPGQE